MTIIHEIRKVRGSETELRRFGLIMCIMISLLSALLAREQPTVMLCTSVALAFLVLAIFRPMFLRHVHKAWMTLALVIGHCVTTLVLTLFFYLVVTPLGIMVRILGKGLIDRHPRERTDTYWIKREQKSRKREDYELQF